MQRTSDDMEDRLDVSELIERITAERGLPVEITGRHRLLLDPDTRRSRRRRLAPAVAGVATVLVATTIAVTLRPGDTPAGPSLDAALVGASAAEPTTEPSPTGDPADEALLAPEEIVTVPEEPAPTTSRRAAAPSAAKPTTAAKPAPAANDGHGHQRPLGPVRRARPQRQRPPHAGCQLGAQRSADDPR